MEPTSPRWQAVTESAFPWERDALAFVRDGLPDHDPYRAWANFEFIADDGSINEVDLLVLAPKGFYLAQRLAVDFSGAHRFDNPRAPQVRLQNFDLPRLEAVGRKIRDLYAEGAAARGRILERADDAYLRTLARAVAGGLGGRVGIAPRVFLKKLVQDVLDRIDLHPDFDPRLDYALTLADGELTDVERNARAATTPDDVELEP